MINDRLTSISSINTDGDNENDYEDNYNKNNNDNKESQFTQFSIIREENPTANPLIIHAYLCM